MAEQEQKADQGVKEADELMKKTEEKLEEVLKMEMLAYNHEVKSNPDKAKKLGLELCHPAVDFLYKAECEFETCLDQFTVTITITGDVDNER